MTAIATSVALNPAVPEVKFADVHRINLKDLLHKQVGRFVGVDFIKKDGSARKLNGRLGVVVKHLKGGDLADLMASTIPDGPEKEAGMRKLLEAKDCFVRAALPLAK